MVWDLIDELDGAEEAQMKRAWTWIRATYGGQLAVHTSKPSLHVVAVVMFAPVSRKRTVNPFRITERDLNPNLLTKRKAFSVTVDPPEAKTLELMRTTGATLPWIQAVLWKRPNKKDAAWVLDVRNAIVVEKEQTFHDSEGRVLSDYLMYCEGIKELVPKSMVPVPAEIQA